MDGNKNNWQIFDIKMCLNQASRPDRWNQAESEFSRVGLTGVRRFLSLPADTPAHSFCLSQYAMLKAFLNTGKKTLLALEDDVIFQDLNPLAAAIYELPANWDILYLGANITDGVFGIKENRPVKYSDHLWSVKRAWMSHAIAYTRPVVETIVMHYPVAKFEMYDDWLSRNILEHYNCFVVNPMVAWQRPGKSDLWGTQSDYTGAFLEGNKIMGI